MGRSGGRKMSAQPAFEVPAVSKPGNGKPVQSVMIIGAGIAGIQSALDMANAGFQVFLVERTPSIGGHMSQLDKTFPTLDCSSCILTPKMADISRHPQIKLLTCTELESLDGSPGKFHAVLHQRPRYVNIDSC